MKKLLALLFSLFFLLSSPSVIADDIDLYELSIKYPQCQNSDYRHECFDDFLFGKDRKNRDAGYFRDNLLWEGLLWENDVLTFETYEGISEAVISCRLLNGWFHCPNGQKLRPLEGGYSDANGKQGRYITHFANGDVFEGSFENGIENGYGKITWSDGTIFEGNYENGAKNGYGKMTWLSGSVYEGNWKNDYQNGYGKMTWLGGSVYEGNYENGIENGYGKMTWSDGDVYVGNWENGNMSD